MSVIELNDVSVTFHEGGRTVEAVKHVNISVEKAKSSASWASPEQANPRWCAPSTCWNDRRAVMW